MTAAFAGRYQNMYIRMSKLFCKCAMRNFHPTDASLQVHLLCFTAAYAKVVYLHLFSVLQLISSDSFEPANDGSVVRKYKS